MRYPLPDSPSDGEGERALSWLLGWKWGAYFGLASSVLAFGVGCGPTLSSGIALLVAPVVAVPVALAKQYSNA